MPTREAAFARASASAGMPSPTGVSASFAEQPRHGLNVKPTAFSAASTESSLETPPTLSTRWVSCAPAFGVNVAEIPATERDARARQPRPAVK